MNALGSADNRHHGATPEDDVIAVEPSVYQNEACHLIGSTPTGAARPLTLAFKEACRDYGISQGDVFLLGCSGGPDSLALGVVAADYAARHRIALHSLTVDHGLRSESADEARTTAALLRRWDVHAHTHHYAPRRWTVPSPQHRQGPEAYARTLRYEAFDRAIAQLRRQGARRVFLLLGHTGDDQAETVLLRLGRGAGAGSLRAMRPLTPMGERGNVFIMRPFLSVRRQHTVDACTELGLNPVADPTNTPDGPWTTSSGDPLRRNAIRHEALPALARALGQDPTPALVRTATLLAADDDALNHYTHLAYRHSVTEEPSPAGSLVFDAALLGEHPQAIRLRVIHAALLEIGAPAGALSAHHLTSVDRLITHWKGQGALHLPGARAVRKATLITLHRVEAIS